MTKMGVGKVETGIVLLMHRTLYEGAADDVPEQGSREKSLKQ
jgi:hypothetical protein